MIAPSITPPPRPFRTGVHDAAGAPDNVDTTDLPACIIRRIWYIGNPDNQIKNWCQAVVDGGGYPMPCMTTQDYTRQEYGVRIAGLLDTNPNCEWIEIGNEPQESGGGGDESASVLERHLEMIAVAAPRIHARGYKALLTHQLQYTGSSTQVFNSLDNGDRGTSWDMIDGIAYHQYPAEPVDVINALNSFRAQIDSHPGAKDKPLILNENGWPSATRADGTGWPQVAGHSDWDPKDSPYWHSGPNQVDRVISLTEQANKVSNNSNTGIVDLLTPDNTKTLRMLGFCWFCYEDYHAYPWGDAYTHTGLRDYTGAARPALARLAAEPFILTTHHFYSPPVATTKTLSISQTGTGSVTVTGPHGFTTGGGGQIDVQTGTVLTISHAASPDFVRWEVDNVPAGSGSTVTVAMNADHALKVVKTSASTADFFVNPNSSAGGDGTTAAINGAHRAFVSIQTGVNALSVGDTLELAGGTYQPTSAIFVNKNNVTIQGDGTYPICDFQFNQGAGFYHSTPVHDVVIDGLDVRNVKATDNAWGIGSTSQVHDCEYRNCRIHDITTTNASLNGNFNCFGVRWGSGTNPYSISNISYNNKLTNCMIWNIGPGHESMGAFIAANWNTVIDGCVFHSIRKEGVRDFLSLDTVQKNSHAVLCWSGFAWNHSNRARIYNCVSAYNQIGYELKHTSALAAQWKTPESGWASNLAPANAWSRLWHNTAWRNTHSAVEPGQGSNPLYDFADHRNNLFVQNGNADIHDFPDTHAPPWRGHHVFFNGDGFIGVDDWKYATGFSNSKPPNFTTIAEIQSVIGNNGTAEVGWETNGLTPALPSFPNETVLNLNTSLTSLNLTAATHTGDQDGGSPYGSQLGGNPGAASAAGLTVNYTEYPTTVQSVSSQGGSAAVNLTDGNWGTYWWVTAGAAFPHNVVLDLGTANPLNRVILDVEEAPDARVPKKIRVETATALGTWTVQRDTQYGWDAANNAMSMPDSYGSNYKIGFAGVSARYVRLTVLSNADDAGSTSTQTLIRNLRVGNLITT